MTRKGEPLTVDLKDMDHRRLFWASAANIWCTAYTK